ncbi:MAG TPA: thiol reductant ABC exporter subunit CydD [Roseococcus sp.]|nr:thiol reductant ABC exporter subunit CydD [Roseococcus sp.]
MDTPRHGRAARAWLTREARRETPRLIRPIALGLAGTLCAIAQAWLIARLAMTLLGTPSGGWSDLGLAAAFAVLAAGLGMAQERAQARAGEAARMRLRATLFARLLEAGPADPRGVGEKAVLLVDRIEALDGFFARWIPAAALAVLAPLAVALAVAIFDPVAALILGVAGLLVPVAMALTGLGAAAESRRQLAVLDRIAGRFVDRLRGLATLVQFNGAEAEARALGATAEEFRIRTLRILRVAFLSTAALELLSAGALAFIAFRHGAPSLGGIFALLAVPAFFAPLRGFSAAYHEAMAARGAAAELAPLLDAPPRPGLRLDAVPPRVALAVTEVSWRPDPTRPPALDRLTFAVAPGETLLVVGASGAGKSSLLRLLMGFARPDSGRIAVNGQDVTRLLPSELRRLCAHVGQRPHLFAGTIADNIRLARPDATEDQLRRATEAARMRLPLGTPVGEGGHGLSGGQAQRVALARAFLRDAPLVLLDEPTAHLDPGTEAEVMEAIARLVTGRTAIIATHSAQLRGLPGRVLTLGHGSLAHVG